MNGVDGVGGMQYINSSYGRAARVRATGAPEPVEKMRFSLHKGKVMVRVKDGAKVVPGEEVRLAYGWTSAVWARILGRGEGAAGGGEERGWDKGSRRGVVGAGTRVRTWVPTGQEEWEEPVWWEGEEGEGEVVGWAEDGDEGEGGDVGGGDGDVGKATGGGSSAPAPGEEAAAGGGGSAEPAAAGGDEEVMGGSGAAASGSGVAQAAVAVQPSGRRGVRRAREGGDGEEDARWRVCTQSMGQVELRVAPRGGEVRLRDVKERCGKRQKRAGADGQGSAEGGASTAGGMGESVNGARETGGMETQDKKTDGGLSGDGELEGGGEMEDWREEETRRMGRAALEGGLGRGSYVVGAQWDEGNMVHAMRRFGGKTVGWRFGDG